MAEKMAGPMAGQAENGQISAIQPFARPVFGPFHALPQKMAAGHFASHFQFWVHFPPVAGQRGSQRESKGIPPQKKKQGKEDRAREQTKDPAVLKRLRRLNSLSPY